MTRIEQSRKPWREGFSWSLVAYPAIGLGLLLLVASDWLADAPRWSSPAAHVLFWSGIVFVLLREWTRARRARKAGTEVADEPKPKVLWVLAALLIFSGWGVRALQQWMSGPDSGLLPSVVSGAGVVCGLLQMGLSAAYGLKKGGG